MVWVSREASGAACRLALALGLAIHLRGDEESVTFGIDDSAPPDVSAFAVAFLSSGRGTKWLNALGEERFPTSPPF